MARTIPSLRRAVASTTKADYDTQMSLLLGIWSRLPLMRVPLLLLVATLATGCSERPDASRDNETAGGAVPQSWSADSAAGRYRLTLRPQAGRAEIGEFQNWVLDVRTGAGEAVPTARIALDGGMPEHGHGLPTQPQVTAHMGDGRYLVEGVRFSMAGNWVLEIAIDGPGGPDRATLELDLSF